MDEQVELASEPEAPPREDWKIRLGRILRYINTAGLCTMVEPTKPEQRRE